jgi:agmatinase
VDFSCFGYHPYLESRLTIQEKWVLANAELAVRALLDAKTMPYILGGDHAITMATVAAYSNEKPIYIVHLDAHFDFIDERNGITWGHGSPMRRASEMAHVKGISIGRA